MKRDYSVGGSLTGETSQDRENRQRRRRYTLRVQREQETLEDRDDRRPHRREWYRRRRQRETSEDGERRRDRQRDIDRTRRERLNHIPEASEHQRDLRAQYDRDRLATTNETPEGREEESERKRVCRRDGGVRLSQQKDQDSAEERGLLGTLDRDQSFKVLYLYSFSQKISNFETNFRVPDEEILLRIYAEIRDAMGAAGN